MNEGDTPNIVFISAGSAIYCPCVAVSFGIAVLYTMSCHSLPIFGLSPLKNIMMWARETTTWMHSSGSTYQIRG